MSTTRADGFATEDGEVTLGLRSVAAVVRDHAGWPAAAFAVTYADARELGPDAVTGPRPADPAPLIAAVTQAAVELSRRIGRSSI